MKRKLAYMLSILLCGVFLATGCGSQTTGAGSSNVKILLSVNAIDDFRQTLVDTAQQEADARGVQLDVFNAEDNIENQVEHIKKAAAEGYDAILCGPVSTDTAVELKANAGDIPIVFFNSCPNE
ncbi:sugar ABC transporter substrate-binding protein, partial [Agathobacter rectalis]|uniref:sugar ABC transporter substrate-binding protein n=1 Tax=Agathobacter rectalis TaxID=39491 RepID=UPI0027E9C090|nr:substrate-binding domain-containing protein [Agathobacter rectalis]